MAFLGQAYDRKKLAQKYIDERKLKVASKAFWYLFGFLSLFKSY